MNTHVFPVDQPEEFRNAGPEDLIRLVPEPGGHPLFLPKSLVETLVYAIVNHEIVHLSGPTGSGKSGLLDALRLAPENFKAICAALGHRPHPLQVYVIEMVTYDSPGEIYQRRALREGATFDEESGLVKALTEATRRSHGDCYPLIWLREIGRVHSASVQGGLLNLIHKGELILPGGKRLDAHGVAWVADSNYQAESEATHTLVTLDDALKRRFTINLTLDYLTAEQETEALIRLMERSGEGEAGRELARKTVMLGHSIRRQKAEGNLPSVAPPTISGYQAFVRLAQAMPHLSLQQVAQFTLLGNACFEDGKLVPGVLNEVFGFQRETEAEPMAAGSLF